MPAEQAGEAVPASVVEAYYQMMLHVIGPAAETVICLAGILPG